MGFLGRMMSRLNATVDSVIHNSSDPDASLSEVIREIEDSIDLAKAQTARVLAEASRLEKEVDAKADEVDEWSRRAETAVDQDNDALARKALERKLSHESELQVLQLRLDETRTAAEDMKEHIRILGQKLDEARARQTALGARARAAETLQSAEKHLDHLADHRKAGGMMKDLEQNVQEKEAKADAMSVVNRARNALEREFENMEADMSVESELAALKARREQNDIQ